MIERAPRQDLNRPTDALGLGDLNGIKQERTVAEEEFRKQRLEANKALLEDLNKNGSEGLKQIDQRQNQMHVERLAERIQNLSSDDRLLIVEELRRMQHEKQAQENKPVNTNTQARQR